MTKIAYFSTELSAGSQLEEDSTVLIDPFSWRYHFFEAKLVFYFELSFWPS